MLGRQQTVPGLLSRLVRAVVSWLFTVDRRVFFEDDDGEIREATEAERRDVLLNLMSLPQRRRTDSDA
jgi:hypothetical protein